MDLACRNDSREFLEEELEKLTTNSYRECVLVVINIIRHGTCFLMTLFNHYWIIIFFFFFSSHPLQYKNYS